jgi:succinyl-CoA synthetase beta subunit
VQALERVQIDPPMVIRLDGTNAEEGRTILKTVESDQVIASPTMLDAARKAVELARASGGAA